MREQKRPTVLRVAINTISKSVLIYKKLKKIKIDKKNTSTSGHGTVLRRHFESLSLKFDREETRLFIPAGVLMLCMLGLLLT